MSPVVVDLLLAAPPFLVGLLLTRRLIWPRWKVPGKAVFYFGVVALLSLLIGHWSVLLGWLHQAVGVAGHIHFSRSHGFTWWAVEDPERYVALSKAAVGFGEEPEPRSGESRDHE